MGVKIITGDCREVLKGLSEGSAQMCVTSPPYFGLRDYGVPGQIGLEESPAAFIDQMVEVFRGIRRVLRDDGTLWLNLGDSYAGSGRGGQMGASTLQGAKDTQPQSGQAARAMTESARRDNAPIPRSDFRYSGFKPKDLMGIPWRVALALQADGWFLRQDIIWAKTNPMPEPVRDRFTKAHEYLFLLSKSERYYFDQDAVREDATSSWDPDNAKAPDYWDTSKGGHGTILKEGRRKGQSGNKARKPPSARGAPADGNGDVAGSIPWEGYTRNRRSVWPIGTQPFAAEFCAACRRYFEGDDLGRLRLEKIDDRTTLRHCLCGRTDAWVGHFATFPPDLIEPCIKAGSPVGGLVLDPFGGAGTTGLVADRLQRDAILIELNPDYAEMAQRRRFNDAPLLAAQ